MSRSYFRRIFASQVSNGSSMDEVPAYRCWESKPTSGLSKSHLLPLSLVVVTLAACGGTSTSAKSSSGTIASSTTTQAPVTLSVTEAPWQLRAPLSRMVLLQDGTDKLVILGGLTASDTSASGAFVLDLTSGNLSSFGNLPAAVHDAAGAIINGRYLVMGGGSTNTVSTVEAIPSGGGSGAVIGNLPSPRSDCSSVTVGSKTYILGGYNGTKGDPSVLLTTTGTSFSSIASLKVPVRYGALAAIGHYLYVFGGISVSGANPGQAVSTIQRIDLSSGLTSVVGSLPTPLQGAAAFVLGGHLYLAGGDTSSSNTPHSSSAVWLYQSGSSMKQVATLPEAVSNAGVAESGGAVWLVGGEHNGKTTSVVQTIKG